jgi:hypothetical protein
MLDSLVFCTYNPTAVIGGLITLVGLVGMVLSRDGGSLQTTLAIVVTSIGMLIFANTCFWDVMAPR